MTQQGTVSVVVVTFNSRAHFARLRRALDAQTLGFRLIVLDNASDPEQRPQPADFPTAELLLMDANLGFAEGNNRAVAGVDSELVALLNPDAFPEPDWLERLVYAARAAPDAAAFGSTQIAADDPTRFDGLGDCYHVAGIPWRGGFGWLAGAARSGETFSPCAAAALYRTQVWRDLGGFDERFFCYCEDVDLGFRIRLAGWRVLQVGDAVVHHVGGASSGRRSDFAVFHGTRNRIWTFVKDMPAPAFWLLLPAHVAITLAFLVWSPFRGTGRATWRGVGAALAGLAPIWAARQQVQCARRAPIADVMRTMAWSPLAMLRRAPVVFP